MERRNITGEMSAEELAEVLSNVRAGDSEAWGELYRRYAPAMFRFCRRALPTPEDAEDATTEIFMKVRQKLGTYDSSRPFTASALQGGQQPLLGLAAATAHPSGP